MVFGVIGICVHRLKGQFLFSKYIDVRFQYAFTLSLLSLDSCNDASLVPSRTELKIPDSLPSSRSKLSILDGDCDTGSNKRRLDVSRHVIGPLSIVSVESLSLGALRRSNSIQSITHVFTNIRVPVLIQTQGTACVLDEKIQKANFVVSNLRERGDDLISYKVRSPRLGSEGELLLEPAHGCCC